MYLPFTIRRKHFFSSTDSLDKLFLNGILILIFTHPTHKPRFPTCPLVWRVDDEALYSSTKYSINVPCFTIRRKHKSGASRRLFVRELLVIYNCSSYIDRSYQEHVFIN